MLTASKSKGFHNSSLGHGVGNNTKINEILSNIFDIVLMNEIIFEIFFYLFLLKK